MVKYEFYDYSWDGKTEYSFDIKEQDYQILIDICCKYSTVMSFIFFKRNENISLRQELEPYRIICPNNITNSFYHYKYYNLVKNEDIRYYRVCPELCNILKHYANSIYEWIQGWDFNNPEDPTFYREDGSAFLTTIIHEGYVLLTPRADEDVSVIVSRDGWQESEENDSK